VSGTRDLGRGSGEAGAERFPGTEDYVKQRSEVPLEALLAEAEVYLRRMTRLRPLSPGDRVFEVGVGTGWFLLACASRGLRCSGIEHNPVLREHALALARSHEVDFDILPGSIENTVLPRDHYDAAVAMSVFEHVRDWEAGLRNVYRALRPGGLLYLSSTNKFTLRSGEYPRIPLYGWLPARVRYRLRIALQGEQIISSSGVDFNQFTYWGLERAFKRVGFTRVVDLFELLRVDDLVYPTAFKRQALTAMDAFPALRQLARMVYSGTHFFCIK
jgi:SAM-dependent methyltransferase